MLEEFLGCVVGCGWVVLGVEVVGGEIVVDWEGEGVGVLVVDWWGWVVLGVGVVGGGVVVDWEGEGLGVVVRMKEGWVSAGSWDGATSEVGWVLLLVVGDAVGLVVWGEHGGAVCSSSSHSESVSASISASSCSV